MSEQYNQPPQQGGGYQPNYNQGGYNQGNPQGEQLAQTSMILGILSLFFVGFILGPLAIIKAKRAEELGGNATVGKVTGWIGAILGVLGIIFVVIYFITIGSLIGQMNY